MAIISRLSLDNQQCHIVGLGRTGGVFVYQPRDRFDQCRRGRAAVRVESRMQALVVRTLELYYARRTRWVALFYDISADLFDHQAQHVALLERELIVPY